MDGAAKGVGPVMAAAEGPPLRQLIGRLAELRLATQLLSSARLVTLIGPGGVGKTRLAQEIAGQARRTGRQVVFVDLGGLDDADLLLGEFAAALGLSESGRDDPETRLVRALEDRPSLLLILDGVEHLARAGAVVRRLLARAPAAHLMATSRTALGVEGEMELAVEPLHAPAGDAPADVLASPAGALFMARAREIGRLRTLDPDDAADVAALCRTLDGLPLALELAAARTRLLSPGAIRRRIEAGEAELLSRPGERGAHRSLEAVMDWSLQLLSDDERAMLFAVSVCVGPFDLPTAGRLCPGVSPLDTLERLVMHGLVRFDPEPDGEPRFRLLETVRASCIRRIPEDQLSELRDRHAHAIRAAVDAEAERLLGPQAAVAAERITSRLDDIRAAFDLAVTADPSLAIDLVAPIWRFWLREGRMREGADRLRRALQVETGVSASRGRGLAALAGLVHQLDGNTAARVPAEEAIALARRVGDTSIELEALPAVVHAAIEDGDLETARRRGKRLVSLASRVNDGRARIRGLALLGMAEGELGNGAAGVRLLLKAASEARALDDPLNEGIQLTNLAEMELRHDRPRQAILHARAASAILRGIDDGLYLGWALASLGCALAQVERLGEAGASLLEAARIADAVDSEEATLGVFINTVPYLRRTGAPELAARLWGSAQRIAGRDPQRIASGYRRLVERELEAALTGTDAALLSRAARDGRQVPPRTMLAQLIDFLGHARPATHARAAGGRASALTPREAEVLRLLGEGLSDSAIGERLSISPKTASVHVSNVKAKLGVSTRVQAAVVARALDEATESIQAEPT